MATNQPSEKKLNCVLARMFALIFCKKEATVNTDASESAKVSFLRRRDIK